MPNAQGPAIVQESAMFDEKQGIWKFTYSNGKHKDGTILLTTDKRGERLDMQHIPAAEDAQ
jgi:hypothetical protein